MYTFNEKDHIHLLNGEPLIGTSTVTGIIAKPLTWWASGLAVEKFGWINSKKKVDGKYTTIDQKTRENAVSTQLKRIKGMSEAEFLTLCDEAYKAHSVKLDTSADAGTDMHAELEAFVKECMKEGIGTLSATKLEKYNPLILPFTKWAYEKVECFLWSELYCYSEKLWVGGISDCGVLLKNGKIGIIDFKSSKESYQSQFIQIAGYDLEITENGGFDKDGNRVFELPKPIEFYAVIPFGAKEFTVDIRYNLEELKAGFTSALTLHKLINI